MYTPTMTRTTVWLAQILMMFSVQSTPFQHGSGMMVMGEDAAQLAKVASYAGPQLMQSMATVRISKENPFYDHNSTNGHREPVPASAASELSLLAELHSLGCERAWQRFKHQPAPPLDERCDKVINSHLPSMGPIGVLHALLNRCDVSSAEELNRTGGWCEYVSTAKAPDYGLRSTLTEEALKPPLARVNLQRVGGLKSPVPVSLLSRLQDTPRTLAVFSEQGLDVHTYCARRAACVYPSVQRVPVRRCLHAEPPPAEPPHIRFFGMLARFNLCRRVSRKL